MVRFDSRKWEDVRRKMSAGGDVEAGKTSPNEKKMRVQLFPRRPRTQQKPNQETEKQKLNKARRPKTKKKRKETHAAWKRTNERHNGRELLGTSLSQWLTVNLVLKKNLGKIQLNPFESFLEANSGRVNTFTSEIWTAAHTAWMRTKEQWIEWNWLKIVKIDWESASERKRRIKGSTENRGTRFWRNGQSDRKRPVGRGKKNRAVAHFESVKPWETRENPTEIIKKKPVVSRGKLGK